MINPIFMCNRHIVAEHSEIHMLRGRMRQKFSIDGWLTNGLIEPQNMVKRHQALVREMTKRAMHHRSPLHQPHHAPVGHVDLRRSIEELSARCPACAERLKRAIIPTF